MALAAAVTTPDHARGDAVVTNGRFTNVCVYPDADRERWDEHLRNFPAALKPADWQHHEDGEVVGHAGSTECTTISTFLWLFI